MKIPIKFRGKNIETGKMAYGYLVIYEKHHYTHWIITSGLEPNEPVEPTSVAQLLGYDANGAEVYEGDILTMDYPDPQKSGAMMHYEYVAHMKGFATTADGCYIPCEKFKEVTKPQAARRV